MNSTQTNPDRLAKGVAIVDLIKILKIYRRKCPLTGVSPATEALFKERILPGKWYPHDSFLELLDFAHKHLLGGDEENAVQMGINGGQEILQGIHKAFVREGDPIGSVLALRHIWPTYYNFGALDGELVDERSIRFTVLDYPDVTIPHAMVTIGWGIAAVRLGGAPSASYKLLEQPWYGSSVLKYRIEVEK